MRDYESRDLCFTKAIEGFPGYLICKDGRVLSLERKGRPQSRILKHILNDNGYPLVHINSKKKTIHRLLAVAFIPNPENKPFVLHRDDNPSNFSLDNLYWGDQGENMKDAYKNGGKKRYWLGKRGKDSPYSRQVNQLKDGKIIKTWDSTRDAGRAGFSYGNIGMVARGLKKSHKGFQWRYVNEQL